MYVRKYIIYTGGLLLDVELESCLSCTVGVRVCSHLTMFSVVCVDKLS